MGEPSIRVATESDLPDIVRLLADDILGEQREVVSEPVADSYLRALREIEASPATDVMVLELDGRVIGTMQVSVLPGIASQGIRRFEIESVRVDSSLRSKGYGEFMIRWAIDSARKRGCGLVQLASSKQRTRAHAFYLRLGFKNSHEGFKLSLV